jgi:hypothetical protein
VSVCKRCGRQSGYLTEDVAKSVMKDGFRLANLSACGASFSGLVALNTALKKSCEAWASDDKRQACQSKKPTAKVEPETPKVAEAEGKKIAKNPEGQLGRLAKAVPPKAKPKVPPKPAPEPKVTQLDTLLAEIEKPDQGPLTKKAPAYADPKRTIATQSFSMQETPSTSSGSIPFVGTWQVCTFVNKKCYDTNDIEINSDGTAVVYWREYRVEQSHRSDGTWKKISENTYLVTYLQISSRTGIRNEGSKQLTVVSANRADVKPDGEKYFYSRRDPIPEIAKTRGPSIVGDWIFLRPIEPVKTYWPEYDEKGGRTSFNADGSFRDGRVSGTWKTRDDGTIEVTGKKGGDAFSFSVKMTDPNTFTRISESGPNILYSKPYIRIVPQTHLIVGTWTETSGNLQNTAENVVGTHTLLVNADRSAELAYPIDTSSERGKLYTIKGSISPRGNRHFFFHPYKSYQSKAMLVLIDTNELAVMVNHYRYPDGVMTRDNPLAELPAPPAPEPIVGTWYPDKSWGKESTCREDCRTVVREDGTFTRYYNGDDVYALGTWEKGTNGFYRLKYRAWFENPDGSRTLPEDAWIDLQFKGSDRMKGEVKLKTQSNDTPVEYVRAPSRAADTIARTQEPQLLSPETEAKPETTEKKSSGDNLEDLLTAVESPSAEKAASTKTEAPKSNLDLLLNEVELGLGKNTEPQQPASSSNSSSSGAGPCGESFYASPEYGNCTRRFYNKEDDLAANKACLAAARATVVARNQSACGTRAATGGAKTQ